MFTVLNEINLDDKQECLLVGVFEKPVKLGGIAQAADETLAGELTELVKDGDISSKKKAVTRIHTLGRLGAKRLIFVGLGKEKELTFEIVREAFGKAFKSLKSSKLTTVAIALDTFTTENLDAFDAAHAFSEAFALSTYEFAGYKQKTNEVEKTIDKITVYSEADPGELSASLTVGHVFGKATNSARDLVNTPGNLLTATDLANYASQLGER